MPDGDEPPAPRTVLDPNRERDTCGVGFVARATGERSNDVLQLALEALSRLNHRGAASTDNSGDGAGLLTHIPRGLLIRSAGKLGLAIGPDTPFAVGMLFLPTDADARQTAERLVEEVLREDGFPILGWRDVPVDPAALGPTARASLPVIRQILVGAPAAVHPTDEAAWERALYLARRQVEILAARRGVADLYVCSLSCRTVVYKALLSGRQMPAFFEDFHALDYETGVAVFHQRFSTNTLPSWPLAHPFRMLAHNGEINTLWGNRNAMAMRRPLLDSPLFGDKVERLRDPIWQEGSDSANLDNAMELLARAGRDPLEAAMMLLPQAWEKYPDVDPHVRAFYEFQQSLLEPWDGPAAIAFSDGVLAGAAVDRNGLRPCRFKVRRDGLVVAASEVGVVDLDPRDVVESGGVGPGEVLLVDFVRGRVVRNRAAKREVARRRPYAEWVSRKLVSLVPAPLGALPTLPALSADDRRARLVAAGYTAEDVKYVLAPMADTGAEPMWSMGDDTAIPPLASRPRPVYAYFRQRFAQVTNPPIDSLRESMVMSLRMLLGRRGSPLVEEGSGPEMLRIERPVLLPHEIGGLLAQWRFSRAVLETTWDGDDLLGALEKLADAAAEKVRGGIQMLVLSDRSAGREKLALPSALALGAVRQRLVRQGLRAQVGLVVETADAFDVHHLAVLFGYGAEAVHPWLAMEAVASLGFGTPETSVAAYRDAAEKGLLKVLSKTGISTLSSYCGGQIFEALGLGSEVLDVCFSGTVSPLGGIGFAELAEDARSWHLAAYGSKGVSPALPDPGRVRFRREGEEHAWSPPVVQAVQKLAKGGGDAAFTAFEELVEHRRPLTPRDLLDFRPATPVPLDEVESVASLLPRFLSSAMSLGALSPEAHATLTNAMNRLGASSNSGEGGEDPDHYATGGGPRADSKIKQVASARFGVTAEYLVHADELEIKIVQGAKPGEGGQLPGHKVTKLIARLRHSVVGVPLISPPPHHDIYSIEDLAQLVHDLRSVNPRARVGVKLVAETGIGTVAAGVAKAWADYILVAGHSGGTGASPLSSIKHTGLPWEIGLAEAQSALVRGRLRHRVEVRTDGGLRSARDVVMAAMLGAERFGFGTAPLVAMGCIMARQCHLNTCPTGIASQKEELRARFKGTEDNVVAFFMGLAQGVREILASLGARTLDEIIGRADLLVRAEHPEVPRAALLDLSSLLAVPPAEGTARRRTLARNERPKLPSLDDEILHDVAPCLANDLPFSGHYPIRNHHLSVGARVSGEIALRYGDAGLPAGRIRLRFVGSAGQSFGAFGARGLSLDLEGEANDYVGKGLSGGEIVLRPFRQAAYASHENQILGNTALYGATAGRLFAAGQAGIRFAVRNSGAVAVVEGAGNHACEYMTGGVVAILGRAGRNFGAGMSNGVAYVLDDDGTLEKRVNPEMVEPTALNAEDEELLSLLVEEHLTRTGSTRARDLLGAWRFTLRRFVKVVAKGEVARERAEEIRTRFLAGAS